jgi:two-component system sensor histidine kinase KdpD
MGASENLLANQQISSGITALCTEIHIASERLNRLVANLLDMSRLESGMLQPKLDWCDIRDIINKSIQGLERELAQHPLTVQVQDELPLIKLDFGLMEQALTNLIYNATVHTVSGIAIDIRVFIENDRCIISVADDGPGISQMDMKKVFEKFYRAEGAATGGTGLGLPITKGFIEAHHGTLTVRNRVPHGTEFLIEIPIETQPETI